MTESYKVFGLILCAGCFLGCSADSKKVGGPCARGELASCGVPCDDATKLCGAGLYCSWDAKCTAECSVASARDDCKDAKGCSPDGHCVVGGAAGGEATGGGANSAATDAGDGTACGEVKLKATPKTPNVIVIVDQSGSMQADFGDNGTRWEVLKASLLANDGLFAELEGIVRFGIVLYSGEEEPKVCPVLSQVSVALNNLDAIRTLYAPKEPIDDTPTGDSINALLDQIQKTDLLAGDDPTIFVLATDGEPDTCAVPNPQNGQVEAVTAVTRAFKLGIRTYMIAVAQDNELSDEHLRDMANAGLGVTAGKPDAPSYRVDDDSGLRAALRGIVGGQLSCTVPLKGKVTAEDPCVGTVRLDGTVLKCNDPNGWELVNESSIKLNGQACDALKTGKKLDATFPCGSATSPVI